MTPATVVTRVPSDRGIIKLDILNIFTSCKLKINLGANVSLSQQNFIYLKFECYFNAPVLIERF